MSVDLESKQDTEKESHKCDGPVVQQGWTRLKVNKEGSNSGFLVEGYVTIYECATCKILFGMSNDSKVRI